MVASSSLRRAAINWRDAMFAQFGEQRARQRGWITACSRAGTLRTASCAGPIGDIETEFAQRFRVFFGGGNIECSRPENGWNQQRLGGNGTAVEGVLSFS
jgi:hypothetical protein